MGSPDFKITDLKPSQLANIKVENKSAGRDYGRRFELVYTDEKGITHHSKELVFRDIYNKIDKLAHKEIQKGNLENLLQIENFLIDMKIEEFQAATRYEIRADKDLSYKILTWFSRLFTFGSHQDKINDLLTDIGDHIDTYKKSNADIISKLKIDDTSTEASLDDDLRFVNQLYGKVKDEYLGKMGVEYMRLNLPEKAIEVAQLVTDTRQKENLIADVAKNYIDAGDLHKASEIIQNQIPTMRPVLEQYAAYKAILQSIERDSFLLQDLYKVGDQEHNRIMIIFEKLLAKGNLGQAELVLPRLDPTLQEGAAYKLVDRHMKDKHYARAIMVATNSPNKQSQLEHIARTLFEEAPKSALLAIHQMDEDDNRNMCEYELSKKHLEKNRLNDAFEVASAISNNFHKEEILGQVIEAYARNNEFDKANRGIALFQTSKDPILSKLIEEVCQPNNDFQHAVELRDQITSDVTHRQLMAKWPALYQDYVGGENISKKQGAL